jgi:hypothetical protein
VWPFTARVNEKNRTDRTDVSEGSSTAEPAGSRLALISVVLLEATINLPVGLFDSQFDRQIAQLLALENPAGVTAGKTLFLCNTCLG